MSQFSSAPPLPEFKIELTAPDISPWLAGNSGVPGIMTFDSGVPGPHVALFSLVHGNEFAGAIVLDGLLRDGVKPVRGRLSIGFVNLAAFSRFDPKRPTASRFIDEDINRVWDPAILNGPRRSIELDRAREIRPFVDTVDVLVDLHSMLWPSEPLILSGASAKGAALAVGIGAPSLMVADEGHVNGRRIIDYPRFTDPGISCAGVLVEAGQHWRQATVETMTASVAGALRHMSMVADDAPVPPAPLPPPPRLAKVTAAVTAMTSQFSFMQAYRGGDIVARRNTLIAMDGETEIRTPYDDCLLVMPSLRPSRGHTAVRLARFEG